MSNRQLNKSLKEIKKRNKKERPLKETINKSEANPYSFMKKKEFWLSEEGLIYLEGLARKGLTDEELAETMGIVRTTLWRWCNENETLATTIQRARAWQIHEVENAMYKCAMGYEYSEEQVTKDGDVVLVTRYAPPSIEAQKFILANRAKGQWKAVQRIELEAEANVNVKSKSDTLAEELFGDDDK